MHLDIQLRLQPSPAFIGILAELNAQFSDWSDGSYDWAAQTTDFLHNPNPLPQLDDSLFDTPLSRRAIQDLLQLSIALFAGNFPVIRQYLQDVRYAFVIGYPRSGGSYLTKELLRGLGVDHKRVSETLAHDGFPELRETWFDWAGNRPYYHMQDAIFQVAEFLVISKLYFQTKIYNGADGAGLIPKKMHKIVAWAGSFKMLLGKGMADYLVTIRHPLPTAISIFEKCGGLPQDGKFPVNNPRCAIERWTTNDLMHLGYGSEEIAEMSYFSAIYKSWVYFYMRMATGGLFLGDKSEIDILPYDADILENKVRTYRQRYGAQESEPEAFLIHDKSLAFAEFKDEADSAVEAVRAAWKGLGLQFPDLICQ